MKRLLITMMIWLLFITFCRAQDILDFSALQMECDTEIVIFKNHQNRDTIAELERLGPLLDMARGRIDSCRRALAGLHQNSSLELAALQKSYQDFDSFSKMTAITGMLHPALGGTYERIRNILENRKQVQGQEEYLNMLMDNAIDAYQEICSHSRILVRSLVPRATLFKACHDGIVRAGFEKIYDLRNYFWTPTEVFAPQMDPNPGGW